MLLRITLFSALVFVSGTALGGRKHDKGPTPQVAVTTRILDVNRFNIQITDRGNLIPSVGGNGGGLWWYTDSSSMWVVYDQGPWIIGKMNGDPAMGMAYWGTSFVPGPMINGRPALQVHPEDSVRFHPYKITRLSNPSEPDFVQWPTDLGAPSSPEGKPLLLGDQLVWSSFNNADTSMIPMDWQSRNNFPHLPIEIHQSFFARESSRGDTSLLANTAFLEWTFINKGTAIIESCYVGLWTDLDVTDPLWNPFSIDTVTQTGYCWDDASWDSSFYEPKATGYTLLFGPRVPDLSSDAIFLGKRIHGYRNLPLSSFWGMRSDFGPLTAFPFGPGTIDEAWNIARGYDRAGQVIIDSVTKLPTRFPWSGDPLIGTGWIYNNLTEGEAGFIFFAGPFTIAPGDTQWTMFALQSAAARDKRSAIRTIRNNAARIRSMSYEEIALPRPLAVKEGAIAPQSCALEQNYPNPFNPKTGVGFQVPVVSEVKLSVYDILGREVAVLVNEVKQPGYYEVIFNAAGLSSGVYFYRLSAGSFVQTRKMTFVK